MASACGQSHQLNRFGQDGFRDVDIGLAGLNVFGDGPVFKRPNELNGTLALVQEGLVYGCADRLWHAHFGARTRERLDHHGFLGAASGVVGGRHKHLKRGAIHLVADKLMRGCGSRSARTISKVPNDVGLTLGFKQNLQPANIRQPHHLRPRDLERCSQRGFGWLWRAMGVRHLEGDVVNVPIHRNCVWDVEGQECLLRRRSNPTPGWHCLRQASLCP